MMKYITNSETETAAFAASVSAMLSEGDTILLHGDLGTGKSVFARGVARALHIEGAMPSPTFTILIPYTGDKKLYHFDLYRLNDPDEFYAAGLEEFIGGDGIALIEWPEMAEISPEPRLDITLERSESDENIRYITVENTGISDFDADRLTKWRAEN